MAKLAVRLEMTVTPYLHDDTVTAAVLSTPELILLSKSLDVQHDNDNWITDSLQTVDVCLKQAKKTLVTFDSLLILKSLIPFVKSTQALRNLVQLFLSKLSALMEECHILSHDKLSNQALIILKDFWSLMSNQHHVITQQTYGRYSGLLFEVLPSLASVYIDLFIAVHSTKHTVEKAAKRLYGWLMFELNERCIKTALLEVYGCTVLGTKLVLPLLRALLANPPDSMTNLDYLLHFILLKRWSFVSTDLCDLIQMSSSLKAPEGFLKWLIQHWTKAGENLPNNSSLKDQRVSECLLALDRQAVEELIDVFSQCLRSVETIPGQDTLQTAGTTRKCGNQGITDTLFFIDKKGNDNEVQENTRNQFSKMKQRGSDAELDIHVSNDHFTSRNKGDSSGLLNDSSSCHKKYEETRKSKDGVTDVVKSTDGSAEETEPHSAEHRQTWQDTENRMNTYIQGQSVHSDTQALPLESAENLISESDLILTGKVNQDIDCENDSTWQSTERKDTVEVSESPEVPSSLFDGNTQKENSVKGKRKRSSDCLRSPSKESKASKKSKTSPQVYADLETDISLVCTNQPMSLIPSHSCSVLNGNETGSTSFMHSNTDEIRKENKTKAHRKVNRVPKYAAQHENSGNNKNEVDDVVQSFDKMETTNVDIKTTNIDNVEYKVGLLLSTIRKSMTSNRKMSENQTDTIHVKTRLRSKLETVAPAISQHETRSRKSLLMTKKSAEHGLQDWIRQSPRGAFKKQKGLMPEVKEQNMQTKSSIKKVKEGTEKMPSIGAKEITLDNSKKSLKMYSPKCSKKIVIDNTDQMIPEKQDKSQIKTSKSPKQGHYFLRTNCSHRLLHADTVCPSCSPDKAATQP